MKLLHTSDLHLGKRVNEFSMLEDQRHILTKIINIIDEETPDAVLIAGDVYDKSVPSAEAVELFDDFLFRLSKRKLKVFVLSGNHDSPERIAFGGRLMDKSGIHLSPVYNGRVEPACLQDEYGDVFIYMLPFVKPTHVRRFYENEPIESYTDAVAAAIAHMNVDAGARNVLLAHQFVTGAERSESEEISVGGLDNVDASVFSVFDYTALGHIHRAQSIGGDTVRYSGTPLKYSFSEVRDRKSVTIAELGEKGSLSVRTRELTPRHDMVELRGTYNELTDRAFYENTTYTKDYVRITLTDEDDVPYAMGRLRAVYPNLMRLDYDNRRTQQSAQLSGDADAERKTPLELFAEFFETQNNQPMSDEQTKLVSSLIEEIWGCDE